MATKRLSPAQRAPFLSDSEVDYLLEKLGKNARYRMQVRAFYREQRAFLRLTKLMNPQISKKVAEQRLRKSLAQESASVFSKPWHLPLFLLLLDSSNLIAAAFGDAKLIQAEEAAE